MVQAKLGPSNARMLWGKLAIIFRGGCRACWMTSAVTFTLYSRVRRHCAYSTTARRHMFQDLDRSRWLHPQPLAPSAVVAPSAVAGSIRSRGLHPQSRAPSAVVGFFELLATSHVHWGCTLGLEYRNAGKHHSN